MDGMKEPEKEGSVPGTQCGCGVWEGTLGERMKPWMRLEETGHVSQTGLDLIKGRCFRLAPILSTPSGPHSRRCLV